MKVREPWYGGPAESFTRTLMNLTPGLRIAVREVRRVIGRGPEPR